MNDDQLKKDFMDDLKRAALMEKKKADLQERELELRANRVSVLVARLEESKRNEELAKNACFDGMDDDDVAKMVKDNNDYMEAAKSGQTFICEEVFKGKVPFFRKNIILIGAKTGEGKSTAVANIVRELISQKNAAGFPKRTLVLTNEERPEDFYNRVTCLIHGWPYVNHDKFTDFQRKTFNEYIPLLKSMITVIGDDFKGGSGWTTSIEGIRNILNSLVENCVHYDAVILDYYQNVTFSQKDPTLNEWAVQSMLSATLDQFKNVYTAPIVVFCQITPAQDGKETDKPFEYRIKGRKQIMVVATFAMEMVAERNLYRTSWVVHKGRFSEGVGGTIHTGFDRGAFVPYTPEFQRNAMRMAEQRENARMNRASGTNILDEGKKELKQIEAPKQEIKDAEIPKKTSSD